MTSTSDSELPSSSSKPSSVYNIMNPAGAMLTDTKKIQSEISLTAGNNSTTNANTVKTLLISIVLISIVPILAMAPILLA